MTAAALLIYGFVVLTGVAIVMAIADRALESRWREVADRRRDAWERRRR